MSYAAAILKRVRAIAWSRNSNPTRKPRSNPPQPANKDVTLNGLISSATGFSIQQRYSHFLSVEVHDPISFMPPRPASREVIQFMIQNRSQFLRPPSQQHAGMDGEVF